METLFPADHVKSSCRKKMPQFRKGSSFFGDNKEFSDVTLACEEGQLVEAHKEILTGSCPQTTIHSPHPLGFRILSIVQVEDKKGGFGVLHKEICWTILCSDD